MWRTAAPSQHRYTKDDGFLALPEAPGLGLELRDETLEKYGVRIG